MASQSLAVPTTGAPSAGGHFPQAQRPVLLLQGTQALSILSPSTCLFLCAYHLLPFTFYFFSSFAVYIEIFYLNSCLLSSLFFGLCKCYLVLQIFSPCPILSCLLSRFLRIELLYPYPCQTKHSTINASWISREKNAIFLYKGRKTLPTVKSVDRLRYMTVISDPVWLS